MKNHLDNNGGSGEMPPAHKFEKMRIASLKNLLEPPEQKRSWHVKIVRGIFSGGSQYNAYGFRRPLSACRDMLSRYWLGSGVLAAMAVVVAVMFSAVSNDWLSRFQQTSAVNSSNNYSMEYLAWLSEHDLLYMELQRTVSSWE